MSPQDTLVFSAIGFQTKKVPGVAFDPSGNDTISLQQKSIELDSVTIHSGGHVEKTIGLSDRKTNDHYFHYEIGYIVVSFMENDRRERGWLREAIFDFDRFKSKGKKKVRVHIFRNEKGEPGASLLDTSVFETVTPWHNKLKVDLSGFGIPFPKEGVFVGLEFVGNAKEPENCEGGCMGPTIPYTSSDQPRTYLDFRGLQFSLQVSMLEGKYENPKWGLVVEFPEREKIGD